MFFPCLLIFLTFPIHLSQSPEKGTDKARLLARMSKMGKNPLSLPGAVTVEPESDDMAHVEQDQVWYGLFLSNLTTSILLCFLFSVHVSSLEINNHGFALVQLR